MKTLKFNEYDALREQLEKEGKSINEFVKEVTGTPLNEVIGENIPFWIKSPKGALAMRGLKIEAKKAKKIIEDKLIEKHYPTILENQKKLINQAELLIKKMREGSDKERIKKSLSVLINNGEKIQAKQLENINNNIDKIIDNFDRKITSYIAKKNLPDRRKLTVENSWIMLTTQVRQAAWNLMLKKSEEYFQSIVKDNEDLVTFEDKLTGKGIFDEFIKAEEAKATAAKEEIKKDKVEEKPAEEEKPDASGDTGVAGETPEKGDEEETKGGDVAGEKEEKAPPKRGEVWTWRGKAKKDGKEIDTQKYAEILVVGPGEDDKGNEIADGLTQVKWVKKEGKKWRPKYNATNAVTVISTNVIMKGKMKDAATPEREFNPAQYKIGTKWNYKTAKTGKNPDGKTIQVEIMKPLKDDKPGSVRVKQAGKEGNGWVVSKSGSILDQYVPKKVEKK